MFANRYSLILFLALGALITASVFFIPEFALAQETGPAFTPITPETGNPLARFFAPDADLADLFNGLFQLAISIGALLAVLQLAYSGWLYMTSEMGNKKEEAKERIRNALIGLLMLLATVLILRQINPDIVSLNILEGFGTTIQQPGTSESGVSTDRGVLTGLPLGWCARVSDTEYFCHNTLQGCGIINGPEACFSYGNIPPGNEPNPVPPSTGYSQRVWIENMGFDEDGNLNRCIDVKGPGWVDLGASYCGAYGGAEGQCCGLLETTPPAETPQGGGGGEEFSTSEIEFIPSGNWCHFSNNTYTCWNSASACIGGSGTTDCIVRTESGWSDTEPPVTIDDQLYVGNATVAPPGSWCYQIGTNYYCSTGGELCRANEAERLTAQPGTIFTEHCLPISSN